MIRNTVHSEPAATRPEITRKLALSNFANCTFFLPRSHFNLCHVYQIKFDWFRWGDAFHR
jgi:hypothetical protein